MDDIYEGQSPPSYDEVCSADDVTLVRFDQLDRANEEPRDQTIIVERPTRFSPRTSQQQDLHPPQRVVGLPPSAWEDTFGARSYTASSSQRSSSSVLPLHLTNQPQSWTTARVYGDELKTYQCETVFGCVVMWLFNFVFGLIAYALASHAETIKHTEPNTARKYGRCSIAVSVAGIIFTIVLVTLYITYHQWSRSVEQLLQTSDSASRLQHG